MDYESYLQSSHWLRLKRQYRTEREWRCVCGERADLDLHHITYERLGNEDLDDLRPLCSRCHALLHQLHREGQVGLDPTLLFFSGRAAVYARSRPDLRAKTERTPKRLSELDEADRREHNRKIRAGEIERDWRVERQLPRRSGPQIGNTDDASG